MKHTRLTRSVMAAGLGLAMLAAGAVAQGIGSNVKNEAVKIEPPTLPFKSSDSNVSFLVYLGLVGILLLVVCSNLIPTKRGHQD